MLMPAETVTLPTRQLAAHHPDDLVLRMRMRRDDVRGPAMDLEEGDPARRAARIGVVDGSRSVPGTHLGCVLPADDVHLTSAVEGRAEEAVDRCVRRGRAEVQDPRVADGPGGRRHARLDDHRRLRIADRSVELQFPVEYEHHFVAVVCAPPQFGPGRELGLELPERVAVRVEQCTPDRSLGFARRSEVAAFELGDGILHLQSDHFSLLAEKVGRSPTLSNDDSVALAPGRHARPPTLSYEHATDGPGGPLNRSFGGSGVWRVLLGAFGPAFPPVRAGPHMPKTCSDPDRRPLGSACPRARSHSRDRQHLLRPGRAAGI